MLCETATVTQTDRGKSGTASEGEGDVGATGGTRRGRWVAIVGIPVVVVAGFLTAAGLGAFHLTLDVWRLVLDYVNALKWPVLIGGAVIYFRQPVAEWIGRVTKVKATVAGSTFEADADAAARRANALSATVPQEVMDRQVIGLRSWRGAGGPVEFRSRGVVGVDADGSELVGAEAMSVAPPAAEDDCDFSPWSGVTVEDRRNAITDIQGLAVSFSFRREQGDELAAYAAETLDRALKIMTNTAMHRRGAEEFPSFVYQDVVECLPDALQQSLSPLLSLARRSNSERVSDLAARDFAHAVGAWLRALVEYLETAAGAPPVVIANARRRRAEHEEPSDDEPN